MLHLIHPVLVHFAVAFLIFGGCCEVGGILARREGAMRLGGALVVIGTCVLVPTIATGYLAANMLDPDAAARSVLDAHEWNGLVLLAVFVSTQVWKAAFRGELPAAQRPFYAAAIAVGVALAAYGAFLGGDLVYGHGVGVLG